MILRSLISITGGFRVDGGMGDWMVKLPLQGHNRIHLVLVQVVIEKGVTFVLFKPHIQNTYILNILELDQRKY